MDRRSELSCSLNQPSVGKRQALPGLPGRRFDHDPTDSRPSVKALVSRRQVLLEGEAATERIPQPALVDPLAIHRAFGSV